MRADILPIQAITANDAERWRTLATRALVPNPFHEPDVVLPAASAFADEGVGVLVVADGTEWRAVLPVRRRRRLRRMPGTVLASWRHLYCFLSTPLVDGHRSEEALAALMRRGASERGVQGLAIEEIDAEGPIAELVSSTLGGAGPATQLERFERAFLRRRDAADYLDRTLGKHHRRELRRQRRRLEAALGPVSVEDRSSDPEAPRRFLELERSGWKGRAGTAMACDPAHGRFFTDLCARWSARGGLQLLELASGGRTIAMKCNLRAGPGTFCFKIAFDEELASFSPGMQLEVANIAAFHGDPTVDWMDSCADRDQAMINRLWEDRRALQSVIAFPRGARGLVASSLWSAAEAARPAWRMVRRSGREAAA